MSVAQRIRFPMARRSERLDPYETLRYGITASRV